MNDIGKKLTRQEIIAIADIIYQSFTHDRMNNLFYLSLGKNLTDFVTQELWDLEAAAITRSAVTSEFMSELLSAIIDSKNVSDSAKTRLRQIITDAGVREPQSQAQPVDPRDDLKLHKQGNVPGSDMVTRVLASVSAQSRKLALAAVGAYAITLTMIAAVPLLITLKTNEQGTITAETQDNEQFYGKPKQPGYSIHYGNNFYAVDTNGYAQININPLKYFFSVIDDRIVLDVHFPGPGGEVRRVERRIGWTEISQILLRLDLDDGIGGTISGHDTELRAASAASSARLVGAAVAGPLSEGRLYIQSVRLGDPRKFEAVDASLDTASGRLPLMAVGIDLASQQQSQLSVVPDAVSVQNYQTFFDLRDPELADGGTIMLTQKVSFFSASMIVETFSLPLEIRLGEAFEVTGDKGGSLTLQLVYPVDVIFFERRDTPELTKALTPLVAKAGFAARVNTRFANVGGTYNALYAGRDVGIAALQAVVRVLLENGADIRNIQANLTLKSGIQNQIQVGGGCYPPYTKSQRELLLHGSVDDFEAVLDTQAEQNC